MFPIRSKSLVHGIGLSIQQVSSSIQWAEIPNVLRSLLQPSKTPFNLGPPFIYLSASHSTVMAVYEI
ncbi:hypothetical protein FJTKL_04008 [Diaporthe vaccinii]|uniref:Uncharacterized protein n=1 Tax=Diaporthe vaccinii TaxID=105482 RepID=A0ABR4DV43_9PEZI